MSPPDNPAASQGTNTGPRGPAVSIVSEIVISMSVLMGAAVLLITLMVNWTYTAVPREYLEYAAYIITPYIMLFAATVAIYGWWLIRRVIVRPLNALVEATQAAADGDLDRRVPVPAENEMGLLTRSFNNMAESLLQGRTELERKLDEVRRLNEDLAQTQRELLSSEKLASVGRLAAGVAHEIGNPLSAIAGYLDILARRKYLEELDREMLGRVRAEVERIHEIIKELLDYSRPQTASAGLIDLNELVGSALSLLSMGQKGWDKVEIVTDPGEIPLVFGNRSALQQLVMSLCLNAFQAMPDGGRLSLATVASEREGHRGTALTVADTGAGIPEDQLERIFDPFFTTKEPGQGTGLGLSICLRIVENMNGRISVRSEPGSGASFRVWLPAAPGDEDAGSAPGEGN